MIHAAEQYAVTAHGITLSQAQLDLARARVAERGLAERVQIELRDYGTINGQYQKIASIGMYEYVGIDTYPDYFKKIRALLTDDGIFLNHGITRRVKRERRAFRRPSASRRIILKYIFPGAEHDQIGHTLEVMEAGGLEVHDVEGLRRHYARTCRLWYEALVADPDAAIGHVGSERYRMWLAYLAGSRSASSAARCASSRSWPPSSARTARHPCPRPAPISTAADGVQRQHSPEPRHRAKLRHTSDDGSRRRRQEASMATMDFRVPSAPGSGSVGARVGTTGRRRGLLLAAVLLAVGAAALFGAPRPALLADPDLAFLLRGMGAIKASIALAVIGLVWWRAGDVVSEARFLAYAAACAALAAVSVLVMTLAVLIATSVVFHATLLALGLLALGDSRLGRRRERHAQVTERADPAGPVRTR